MTDDMVDREGERKSEAWRRTELLVCEAAHSLNNF